MSNIRTINPTTGTVVLKEELDPKVIESIVINGDLSKLAPPQKVAYYNYRCQNAGLDPAAKPFDLLKLNGKEVLYANASATQQLCAIHRLSTQITHRERVDDIYLVSCRVTGADGRVSENQGAVSIANARGDALANAILKATTKAIRRAVLSHCGLGMLDETEVETIPGARAEPLVISQPATTQGAADGQESLSQPKQGEGIVLMIPGMQEAYSRHANNEDWVDAYLTMVDKIADSKKFTPGDKLIKLEGLEKENSFIIGTISQESRALYEVLSAGIGRAKLSINDAAKKNPSQSEDSL
jgi:hypothetical protein